MKFKHSKKTPSKNYQEKLRLITETIGPERFKFDESLSPYMHSKLDVVAECLYIVTTSRELIRVLEILNEVQVPHLIFGNGTKILVMNQRVDGLVIKNRTSSIKIAGIKGKVGQKGLGVQEALIEIDSGVTIGKLNEYLQAQNLQEVRGFSSKASTLGGAVFYDPQIKKQIQLIKVWSKGEILEIDTSELDRINHVILSVVIKCQAKE